MHYQKKRGGCRDKKRNSRSNESFQQRRATQRHKVEEGHAPKVVCRRMKGSDRVERMVANIASKMVVPKNWFVDVPNLLT
jgi:hypothetical protein